MVKISINRCKAHDFWSLSVDDDLGGTRITPSKCCGQWTTVRSWDVEKIDFEPLLKAKQELDKMQQELADGA